MVSGEHRARRTDRGNETHIFMAVPYPFTGKSLFQMVHLIASDEAIMLKLS